MLGLQGGLQAMRAVGLHVALLLQLAVTTDTLLGVLTPCTAAPVVSLPLGVLPAVLLALPPPQAANAAAANRLRHQVL